MDWFLCDNGLRQERVTKKSVFALDFVQYLALNQEII